MGELIGYVAIGLLLLILINVLLVQAMLKNHHDQTAYHGDGKPDDPVE